MFHIRNLSVFHRDLPGPVIVALEGKTTTTTHTCKITALGKMRTFCVCNTSQPTVCHVFIDREVLIRYGNGSSYAMIPSSLLVECPKLEWSQYMDPRERIKSLYSTNTEDEE